MKGCLNVLLLFTCLFTSKQGLGTVLPDACGYDKIQFDVKTQKHQSPPASPEPGKAQVVFLGQVDASAMGGCIGCNTFSARVGMDGSWVGVLKGNSYFSINVDPGEHHLCAYWKSIAATRGKNVAVSSFTAEASNVYYFQIMIKDVEGAVSGLSSGCRFHHLQTGFLILRSFMRTKASTG